MSKIFKSFTFVTQKWQGFTWNVTSKINLGMTDGSWKDYIWRSYIISICSFPVFSSVFKKQENKSTVCPSSKQTRWPQELVLPQFLFQTVVLKHANLPNCSSASGEKSKAVWAYFHFISNGECCKNILLERLTGFPGVKELSF